jgi:hypothetical protein
MAVIYLMHPVHGHKVACNDMEADNDENHGWERYTVDTPIVEEFVVEEVESEVEAAPANALEVKTRRRKTTA